ncbi:MAG TPA: GNAT family N-acetyltransferase [Candidatus Nanoarchaeia archaeon]|nr:GNAT family N-acetyltransferase [Candidatus Nanoarchaeia archaeon]
MIHKIQLLTSPEEVQRLYAFIRQFPMDYPDYFAWLEKCRRQLELKEKKAFYATALDNEIIGDLIFQNLKGSQNVLEIKNFRVAQTHQRFGVGSALESMLYSFAKSTGFKRIQVDTHQDNLEMIQFLIKRGYNPEAQAYLYTLNKSEVILSKSL